MATESPFTPAECDLRGLPYMPLFGDRLFGSATWIAASSDAKVAALRLWWRSFAHEVPAASLPDDDQLLADYAGYGIGVKAWRKVKPQAMRGWIKCSDGRLYHRTVAEVALEAWDQRKRNREKQAKWRNRNRDITPAVTVTEGVTKPLCNAGSEAKEKGSEGKGSDSVEQQQHDAAVPPSQVAMAAHACADAAFTLWLPVAYELGIPDPGFLNRERRALLAERLAEIGGIEGWKLALDQLRNAAFLRDDNDPMKPKRWVNLATLCKPENFIGLMEGRYAERHADSKQSGGLTAALAGLA